MPFRKLMDYVLLEGPEVVIAPADTVTGYRYLGKDHLAVDTYGLPSCGIDSYRRDVVTAVQAYTDSDIAVMLHELSGQKEFDRVMQIWCDDSGDYELIPKRAYLLLPAYKFDPDPEVRSRQMSLLDTPDYAMKYLKGSSENEDRD